MIDSPVATSAAPLARRGVARRRLRVVQRAQSLAVAASLLATSAAWAALMNLDEAGRHTDERWFALVPLLVAASAIAVFVRGLWAIVAVRAALWGSLVCGAVVVIGEDSSSIDALPLAIAAGVGLLFLGRFSRGYGGARPLVIALAVLAVSDAATHGILAFLIALDGIGNDANVFGLCAFAALANVIGLGAIVRRDIAWPHVLGNAILFVLLCADVLDAPLFITAAMAMAAAVQIGLALALRLPRASPRVRRIGERGVRFGLVLALAALSWVATLDPAWSGLTPG